MHSWWYNSLEQNTSFFHDSKNKCDSISYLIWKVCLIRKLLSLAFGSKAKKMYSKTFNNGTPPPQQHQTEKPPRSPTEVMISKNMLQQNIIIWFLYKKNQMKNPQTQGSNEETFNILYGKQRNIRFVSGKVNGRIFVLRKSGNPSGSLEYLHIYFWVAKDYRRLRVFINIHTKKFIQEKKSLPALVL